MKDQFSLLLFVIVFFCSIFSAKAQYVDFDHDGITRQYIYYEPSVLNDQMPLVFVMHGFTDDASSIRNYSKMNQFANQYGFAVCYPRGTLDSSGDRFWNVGYAFHENETVDDVGFLTELAEFLQVSNIVIPRTFY